MVAVFAFVREGNQIKRKKGKLMRDRKEKKTQFGLKLAAAVQDSYSSFLFEANQ